MVENNKLVPHKHAEVMIAYAQGNAVETQDNSGQWQPVLGHPQWYEESKYRVKPEVAKPKWPETTMTETELEAVYYYDAPGYNHTVIANAAIAHALETGLVVLPSVSNNTAQVDYKKDIEDWGSNALNEAAREFISKQDKHYVLSCSGAVGIKAAILKYLECVEKEVV